MHPNAVIPWIVFVALLAGWALSILRIRRKNKLRDITYNRRLQAGQNYLQEIISKIDNLRTATSRLRESAVHITSETSNRERFLQTLMDQACHLSQTEMASICFLDAQNLTMQLAATKGLGDIDHKKTVLRVGEGFVGLAVRASHPLYAQGQDIKKMISAEDPVGTNITVAMAYPLRSTQRIIGVLTLSTRNEHYTFGDYAIKMISILSEQAACLWENIELYHSLQNFSMELVQTLSQTIDPEDRHSRERVVRARRRARGIVRRLKVPDVVGRYVEYASILHDIGKVGVDDTILKKPGKLTREEYEKVKKHPEIGAQMIAPVSYFSPVAPMIRYHQEWYNGQGYPEGLAGEEIPLGARIVAILKVWEALTSDRPYRKALSRSRAIGELQNSVGTQFDPKVVSAFLSYLEEEEPDLGSH